MIRRIITGILFVCFLTSSSILVLAGEGSTQGPPSRPPTGQEHKRPPAKPPGWDKDVAPPGLGHKRPPAEPPAGPPGEKGPPSRPPGWDEGKKEGWGSDVPPGLEKGKKPGEGKAKGKAKKGGKKKKG